MHTYLYMHVQEMKYIFYEYDCVEIFWEQIVMSSSTNSRYSKSVIVYGWWLYWCTCMSTVTPISRPTGLFVWRVRASACMRMRQHTCKPIGGCYLSHAWKVIFSWKRLVHRIFFFQSFVFVYERHLWIMQYMSIAYRRCWLRRPKHCPKWKVSFIRLFCVGFQFRFFLRTAQAYTVYCFKC